MMRRGDVSSCSRVKGRGAREGTHRSQDPSNGAQAERVSEAEDLTPWRLTPLDKHHLSYGHPPGWAPGQKQARHSPSSGTPASISLSCSQRSAQSTRTGMEGQQRKHKTKAGRLLDYGNHPTHRPCDSWNVLQATWPGFGILPPRLPPQLSQLLHSFRTSPDVPTKRSALSSPALLPA